MLSAEQDPIFEANMYENFGDVGTGIARLVDELQQKDKRKRTLQTLGTGDKCSSGRHPLGHRMYLLDR